jgi:hypothetical protein
MGEDDDKKKKKDKKAKKKAKKAQKKEMKKMAKYLSPAQRMAIAQQAAADKNGKYYATGTSRVVPTMKTMKNGAIAPFTPPHIFSPVDRSANMSHAVAQNQAYQDLQTRQFKQQDQSEKLNSVLEEMRAERDKMRVMRQRLKDGTDIIGAAKDEIMAEAEEEIQDTETWKQKVIGKLQKAIETQGKEKMKAGLLAMGWMPGEDMSDEMITKIYKMAQGGIMPEGWEAWRGK